MTEQQKQGGAPQPGNPSGVPIPEQEIKEAFTAGGKSGSNDRDSEAERAFKEREQKR